MISEETIDRAVEAFKKFREAIDQAGVRWTRAVATSATREALNRELFIDRIAQASGIEVATISTRGRSAVDPPRRRPSASACGTRPRCWSTSAAGAPK